MSDLTVDEILAGVRLRVYPGDAVYTLADEIARLRSRVAVLEEVVAADDAYGAAYEAFFVAGPGVRSDEDVIAAKERYDKARDALAKLDGEVEP